jgi:hypothetical protein
MNMNPKFIIGGLVGVAVLYGILKKKATAVVAATPAAATAAQQAAITNAATSAISSAATDLLSGLGRRRY